MSGEDREGHPGQKLPNTGCWAWGRGAGCRPHGKSGPLAAAREHLPPGGRLAGGEARVYAFHFIASCKDLRLGVGPGGGAASAPTPLPPTVPGLQDSGG